MDYIAALRQSLPDRLTATPSRRSRPSTRSSRRVASSARSGRIGSVHIVGVLMNRVRNVAVLQHSSTHGMRLSDSATTCAPTSEPLHLLQLFEPATVKMLKILMAHTVALCICALPPALCHNAPPNCLQQGKSLDTHVVRRGRPVLIIWLSNER